MILKAYYSGGRIDVFDTDHHVDAVPQRGNLLANYTLDLSDVAGAGLWLRSYYHEAADAYREEPGPTGLPVEYPSLMLSALRSPDLVSPEGGDGMPEAIGVPSPILPKIAACDTQRSSPPRF